MHTTLVARGAQGAGGLPMVHVNAAALHGEHASDEAAALEGLADVELYLLLSPAVAARAQALKLVVDTALTTTTATPTTATL